MKLLIEDILSILTAVPKTVAMALVILIFGLSLGTIVTLGDGSRNVIIKSISRAFIWYIRGIPLIVHIFIVYYLLPKEVPAVFTLVVTYIVYSAATQSENIRTALKAVPKDQYEAAYCVGLTKAQTFRRIIFPQAIVVVLPILLNVFLNIIKGLSLAFLISVVDILAQSKFCIAKTDDYLTAYAAAGLVYWGVSIVFNYIFGRLEKYFYKKQGVVA